MSITKSWMCAVAAACCVALALAPGLRAQAAKPEFRGGDPRMTEPAVEEMLKAWVFLRRAGFGGQEDPVGFSGAVQPIRIGATEVRSAVPASL